MTSWPRGSEVQDKLRLLLECETLDRKLENEKDKISGQPQVTDSHHVNIDEIFRWEK